MLGFGRYPWSRKSPKSCTSPITTFQHQKSSKNSLPATFQQQKSPKISPRPSFQQQRSPKSCTSPSATFQFQKSPKTSPPTSFHHQKSPKISPRPSFQHQKSPKTSAPAIFKQHKSLKNSKSTPAIFKHHKSLKNFSTANGFNSTLNIYLSKEKRIKRRDKRATLILGLILFSFIICWLPFFIFYVLSAFEIRVDEILFDVAFWLGYCNSALNPFIYAALNRDFRNAFSRILCWKYVFRNV